MNPTIKKCTTTEVALLSELSCSSFREAFGDVNTEENLNSFLEKAYNYNKLQAEMTHPHSSFYLLFDGNTPAGYLKVNDSSAQSDINDPNSLEIERIYLLQMFKGKGYGKLLIETAINLARSMGKSYVWLGVWEQNHHAIGFYKKFGFYEFSKHTFFVGDDEQKDLLLRKDLL